MPAHLDEWLEILPAVEEIEEAERVIYQDRGKRLTDEQMSAAVLLIALIWKEGGRHALAMAVAGMLAKEGYGEADARNLVGNACIKAGDREVGDRERAVRDTYRAARQGQPVKAWRELESKLPTDSLNYLRSIISSREPVPGDASEIVTLPPSGTYVQNEEKSQDDAYKLPFRLTQRREFPSYPMLIEGLLPSDPRGSVAYLTGLSQSFKSYLALDWAGHVSQGMNWHGHDCEKAQVLYVAAEGSYKDILSRLRAWEAHHETKAENLYCRLSPISILDPEVVDRTIGTFARNDDFAPRLVILDTLSQCAGSADENSSRDARMIYQNAKKFGLAFGSTVLIVHHSGKAEGAIARGSSAYFDDSDAVIQMVRPGWQSGALDCTMHVRKIKSGKMTLNHEMNAREVEWEEDGRRGKDLVLVQRVLQSAYNNVPKLL